MTFKRYLTLKCHNWTMKEVGYELYKQFEKLTSVSTLISPDGSHCSHSISISACFLWAPLPQSKDLIHCHHIYSISLNCYLGQAV